MGVGGVVRMKAEPGFEGPPGRYLCWPLGCCAPFRRVMGGSYIPQINEKPGKILFKERAREKSRRVVSLENVKQHDYLETVAKIF